MKFTAELGLSQGPPQAHLFPCRHGGRLDPREHRVCEAHVLCAGQQVCGLSERV